LRWYFFESTFAFPAARESLSPEGRDTERLALASHSFQAAAQQGCHCSIRLLAQKANLLGGPKLVSISAKTGNFQGQPSCLDGGFRAAYSPGNLAVRRGAKQGLFRCLPRDGLHPETGDAQP